MLRYRVQQKRRKKKNGNDETNKLIGLKMKATEVHMEAQENKDIVAEIKRILRKE